MEKMDPESHEWGYIGRKFAAEKLWAPTAASRFLQALEGFAGIYAASDRRHTEHEEDNRGAMKQMESPNGGSK